MATENGAISVVCELRVQSVMKSIGDNLAVASPKRPMLTIRPSIRQQRYLFLIVTLLLLSGCAKHYTVEAYSDPYGFFSGIWHGFIFPYALVANIVSWILSLFGISFLADVQIVGRPNTGFFFYYIGFFLGLSSYGGAGAASRN